LKEFRQYVVAASAEEATRLKRSLGPAALYLAGGTSFVPFIKTPVDVVIDISRLGLSGVVVAGGRVTIGATTRIADLLAPEVRETAPMLYKAGRRLATPLVRNMATVGGNLAYAFLPSDLAVALLAAGGEVEILGEGARTVPVEKLLDDGWLGGDDLVCKISLAEHAAGRGTGFAKFGRGEVDIALVSAAVRLDTSGGAVSGLRVAVGQTSAMPAFLDGVARGVMGEKVCREVVERVGEAASAAVEPHGDHRASADYRRHLIGVMVRRAFAEAAEEAGVAIEN